MRLPRFRRSRDEFQVLEELNEPFGEAEVHRFEGRTFVTAGWASGWGAPVPPDASADEIGALVRRALEESRRNAEPRVLVLDDRRSMRQYRKRARERERGWERFIRDVAGTSVERYSPEIRIEVLDTNDGHLLIRPLDVGKPIEDAEVELSAEADPSLIGDAVNRLLSETRPNWPSFRQAELATEANGRLVLYPIHGIHLGGPVLTFAADVDPAELGVAIRETLDASTWADEPPETFGHALAEAGIDERDLAGGAHAGISETTQGSVVVNAWKPVSGGWEPADLPESAIEDGDVEAAATAALAVLAAIPTSHRRPGIETGSPFAYKIAWLAVRTERSADVVEALGLTKQRRLPWEQGISESYDRGVFVTPATSGWVLAVGVGWFGDEPDIADLSARLSTEVQFFATHRVVGVDTWQLARGGVVVRRVSYVGESGKLEESGAPTAAEEELGLVELTDESAMDLVSENTTLEVAAEWSLDPRELATTPTTGPTGTHGELSGS